MIIAFDNQIICMKMCAFRVIIVNIYFNFLACFRIVEGLSSHYKFEACKFGNMEHDENVSKEFIDGIKPKIQSAEKMRL